MSEADASGDEQTYKQGAILLLGELLPAVLALTASTNRRAAVAFNDLLNEAAQGSRLAIDRIKNPWGTSEAPKSALARARLRRGEAYKNILEHLTPLITAYIALAEADEVTRAYNLSKQRQISDDAGQRFLDLLNDSGVTQRTLLRTSSDTVAAVAEMLNDRVVPPGMADADLLASLKQHRLLDLVCETDGGDWAPGLEAYIDSTQWPVKHLDRLLHGNRYCYIPRQLALDAARPSRGHARWQRRQMHEFMWDELGASRLFRVFVRSDEDHDQSKHDRPLLELPPFATLKEMIANDSRFAAIYASCEADYRRLDAERTLKRFNADLQDVDIMESQPRNTSAHLVEYAEPDYYLDRFSVDEIGAMDDAEYAQISENYHITQQLINFAAAQIDVIRLDIKWASSRDWGTLLSTIDQFLDTRDDSGVAPWQWHQNLVWLYLLKGRFCENDVSLPPRFRELLFDWLQLPVAFAEEYCTRFLVPVSGLNGELADDDAAIIERRMRARQKRIRRR